MKNQTRILILAASALSTITAGAEALYSLGEDVNLHALADVSVVYEDNVLLTPNFLKDSDMHLVFSPGLELALSSGPSASTVIRYQHTFTRYDDLSELDDDYANLSFQTRYDSGVVLATIDASYKEEYSNSYGIDTALDAYGVLILRDVTRVNGRVKYDISELTALGVGVNYTKLKYDLARFADHESFAVPVTVYYKVRPTIDLTAGIRYRNTDTDANLRYEDYYYFVGAVGELGSPVLYADINIGYQDRKTKFGMMPDSGSASYDFSLIYTGNPRSTLWAGISRDYRTSAQSALTYAFSSISVGGSYSMSETISINASAAIAESEYEESFRKDDINIFRLGASYSPNDYLTVSANYYYRDVDGNVANYTDNEISVTASLRY